MSATINEDLAKTLSRPVPREHLRERTGAGNQTLHYVDGDYVIHTINKTFGTENVSTHIDEVREILVRQVKRTVKNPPKKNPAGGYTEQGTQELDYFEIQFMVRGRVEIEFEGKTFTKSGIGTGKGSGWATSEKTLAQTYEVAIKGAETDMIKRASKKLGALFGLSIGDDGRQLYASTAEDEIAPNDDLDDKIDAPVDVKTDKAPAAETKPAAAQTANPAQTKAPAAAEHQAASVEKARPVTPTPKPTPEAPKVEAPKVEVPPVETPKVEAPVVETPTVEAPKREPVASPAPKTDSAPVETVNLNPVNAKAEDAKPADAAGVGIQLPPINVAHLKEIASAEWIDLMKGLKDVLTESKTEGDIIAVATQVGRYKQILDKSERIDDAFKGHVVKLITKYIVTQAEKLDVKVDVEAVIAAAMNEGQSGDQGFDVPF